MVHYVFCKHRILKKTTELCLLLVEETYGELAARIFKVLMVYGRQRLSGIIHHTGLAPTQIKHGLVVLIQQHIVIWSLDDACYYEADWLAAYSIVRSGKFVIVSSQRTSSQAGAVLSRCIQGGDMKANQLEHTVDDTNSKQGNVNGINGSSIMSISDRKEACEAIYGLLEHKIFTVTNTSHFRGRDKNRKLAKQHVGNIHPAWKDKVKNAEKDSYEVTIVDTLDEWKYGSKCLKKRIAQRRLTQLDDTSKREFTTIEGLDDNVQALAEAAKSSKSPPSSDVLQGSFDNEIVLRANFDKYPVLVRSQKLIQLAAENIGVTTSQVYAIVLHLYDKDLAYCNEFQRNPEKPLSEDEKYSTMSTQEIFQHIGHIENLQSAIGQPHKPTSTTEKSASRHEDLHRKKRQKLGTDRGDQPKSTENGWNSDSNSGSDSDIIKPGRPKLNGSAKSKDANATIANGEHKDKGKHKVQITYDQDVEMNSVSEDDDELLTTQYGPLKKHLMILAEHGFLSYHPLSTNDGKSDGWSVPFAALSHRLRVSEMNTTIRAQFGTDAFRIVKILQDKGKLDEKSLIGKALMESKTMRSRILAMHKAGYVELQELPRDNNRIPSKIIYLWFFDEGRCARQMEQHYYQAMSRCLQRLREERERASDVLAKSQRSDVQGREQEFLAGDEWNRLQKWKEVEELLIGMVGRLDDGILFLRDL